MKLFLVTIIACLAIIFPGSESNLFYVTTSSVKFRSEAPLEVISAESSRMQGVIDQEKRTFVFTVLNSSFQGFNNSLQRVHFNENYMESDIYPLTSFKGKIIEEVDFNVPGVYQVRAKGLLTVHGIVKERIIRAQLTTGKDGVELESNFTVSLKDHNIRVPKVVHEKIASEIKIEIKAALKKK
ncbi:MAG: YceI family protein [Bacteroidota bacterium]